MDYFQRIILNDNFTFEPKVAILAAKSTASSRQGSTSEVTMKDEGKLAKRSSEANRGDSRGLAL